ncbi:MAG TPA: discoidin domain-containing protein [Chitinophagaceae bacterium]|jgi:mannan endo-1,4-beta-mannosidase|nr:discoidin domain-containing protein [Chitinophagaceae bacterium]
MRLLLHHLRRGFFPLLLLCTGTLSAQLKVTGRYLYDPCGERIVLRGVNEMFIYSSDRTGAVTYPEIAKTGANAVRFMWMIDPNIPVSAFADNVRNCIANKMIPIPGLWNATGKWGADFEACVQWWLKPEVVTVCRNNPYLIVNIANEAGGAQMADYTSVYINAIQRLRNAGITNVIMVDADRWGRSWETIRDKAIAVRDGDPQKNVLFGWHPWDTNMDYATPIRTIAQKDICLVVGEFSYKSVGCACCINYKQIMSEAQVQGVGTLAWSWGLIKNGDCTDGSMDMTTNGTFAGLKAGWPTEIATTDANSIRNTSVRPYSLQNNGACRPVTGTNLALNKPAVSSTSESTTRNAAKAFDGNTATRWASVQQQDPQWIYVDLGGNYNLSKVILRWEAAYGRGYQIQTSGNASTWTTVYTTTTGDGGVDELTLSGASGRYVRLNGTARGTTWGYSLWEFEVYGTSAGGGTSVTTTLSPVADTDSQSDVAAGTNASLNSSKYCHLFTKFSLTGIGTVTSARLRLYKNSTNTGTLNVNGASTDNWSEGTARPTTGNLVTSAAMPGSAGYIEIDVTNTVKGEAAGDDAVTFALTTNLDTWTGFVSRQSTTNKPELVIVHTTGSTAAPASRNPVPVYAFPEEAVSVYPNPASSLLEIRFTATEGGRVTYRLSNASNGVVGSRTLTATPGRNEVRVPVSALHEGVYFLQLEWEGRSVTRKVVIAR